MSKKKQSELHRRIERAESELLHRIENGTIHDGPTLLALMEAASTTLVAEPVLLRQIPGYTEATKDNKQKGKQQRCVICNDPTSWACKQCSSGPHQLVPVCPYESKPRNGPQKGQTVQHACCGLHSNNPSFQPHGKQAQSAQKGAKRARTVGGSPQCSECDDE